MFFACPNCNKSFEVAFSNQENLDLVGKSSSALSEDEAEQALLAWMSGLTYTQYRLVVKHPVGKDRWNNFSDSVCQNAQGLAHEATGRLRKDIMESNEKCVLAADGQWASRRGSPCHFYTIIDVNTRRLVAFSTLQKSDDINKGSVHCLFALFIILFFLTTCFAKENTKGTLKLWKAPAPSQCSKIFVKQGL